MVLAFIVVFVGAIVVSVELLGATILGIVAIFFMIVTPHIGSGTIAPVSMTAVVVFLTFIAAIVTTVFTAF